LTLKITGGIDRQAWRPVKAAGSTTITQQADRFVTDPEAVGNLNAVFPLSFTFRKHYQFAKELR